MAFKQYIEAFRLLGDRIALRQGETSQTYDGLYAAISEAHNLLICEGVAPGETVLLGGNYSTETIAMFFALYQNGNIIAIDATDERREWHAKLASSGAAVMIDMVVRTIVRQPPTKAPQPALITQLIAENKAGLILFSSGSTGQPKLMLHDLDNLIADYRDRRPKSVVMLIFLLFDHIGGMNTLLNILGMGGTAVIPLARTPDEAGALIERHSVSILPTSPTFLNLMMIDGVFEKYDVRSLRMITYGTEPMPEGLLVRLRKALPFTRLLQTFGTSETGIVSTTSKSSDSLFIKFNDPTVEHKVVNGELWLKSNRRILGYLNHSNEDFDQEGWFRTGDLVEEKDGFLRIKGRRKEVINVGGEKVLPSEVESVLMAMPGILDCKVFGERSHLTGQFVVADIVLHPNNARDSHSVQNIRKFALSRMDSHKVPVRINFVADIPYSARFKKQLKIDGGSNLPSAPAQPEGSG